MFFQRHLNVEFGILKKKTLNRSDNQSFTFTGEDHSKIQA